jgi:hypothetical protein
MDIKGLSFQRFFYKGRNFMLIKIRLKQHVHTPHMCLVIQYFGTSMIIEFHMQFHIMRQSDKTFYFLHG